MTDNYSLITPTTILMTVVTFIFFIILFTINRKRYKSFPAKVLKREYITYIVAFIAILIMPLIISEFLWDWELYFFTMPTMSFFILSIFDTRRLMKRRKQEQEIKY